MCQGDFVTGEEDLHRSLAVYRGFHTIWFLLAINLIQQDKTQEARNAVAEILRIQADLSPEAGRKGLSIVLPKGIPKPVNDGIDKLAEIWPQT